MAAGASTSSWSMPSEWYNPTAYFKPDAPPPPAEIMTLRAEQFVADKQPEKGTPDADVAGARELFRRGEYEKAEHIFHYHAERSANSPLLRAEARFYEAECLRLQGAFPKAADLYLALLNNSPENPYREQSLQHVFDIACFWLEDTQAEIKENDEKMAGKRWFVWPRFVSFEKSKPLLGREDQAVHNLDQVRINDISGPLADKALFLCGTVKFFNQDFREADYFFTQIRDKHPKSPLAPRAIELAIIAKHLSTGGPDYDFRKIVEARMLVQEAFASYPELANNPAKRKFLERELASMTKQQAEKDFRTAELYGRLGHPGSAYWYYALVMQRYPNTDIAAEAAKRMEAIKADVEKENAAKAKEAPKLPSSRPADPVPSSTGAGSAGMFPGGAVPGQGTLPR